MNNCQKPDRIEKALAERGIYASKTEGVSMQPMLVQGRDTVIIKKPEFPLKKFDIPVYHRGTEYIMHRIIKVEKEGYVICGDNCIRLERDITDADIVGVLAAFYRNGKYVECGGDEDIKFAKRAVRTYPLRLLKNLFFRILYTLKAIIKRIIKKR